MSAVTSPVRPFECAGCGRSINSREIRALIDRDPYCSQDCTESRN